MDAKIISRKGQATIFIIAGIILVATVGLIFLLRSDIIPNTGGNPEEDPNGFLENCVEDKLSETMNIISLQGGYVESVLFKGYDDKNISYLCYNAKNYFPCINQEPMLFQHLKDEIHDEIEGTVNDCFDSLTSNLEREGYAVEVNYGGFEVGIKDKRIEIDYDAELALTKSGETSREEELKMIFPTKFYDLGIVTQEIISQEAEYCNFNSLGYMLIEPNIKIEKKRLSDSTTIYHLTHKKTMEEFWFAVRSCALPGGL